MLGDSVLRKTRGKNNKSKRLLLINGDSFCSDSFLVLLLERINTTAHKPFTGEHLKLYSAMYRERRYSSPQQA